MVNKLKSPDEIFDNCNDTIECIKEAQKDAVIKTLLRLPHTKWCEIDMENRQNLINKIIEEIENS